MACWMRATRAVRKSQHRNENRFLEVLPSNNQDVIPPPPPMPELNCTALNEDRLATSIINMVTYKRASSTSRHCIFSYCGNSSRLLVPRILKERLLADYSFYVPRCARICEYHLNEGHNDWQVLHTLSNHVDFTAAQMEDLCSLLISGSRRRFHIENIIEHSVELCKYWLGITYQQFEQLLLEIPMLQQRVSSPKKSLAMYLIKLRTGDSNRRLASLFDVAESTIHRNLNSVRQCFEEQFLPLHLGTNNMSIQQVAQYNLILPNGLFGNTALDLEDIPAIVICDGTYVYIQKSSNYMYQKQTYSLHKYRNLVKPFLLVCCNGYIIDVYGPYPAIESDASIMIRLFAENSLLRSFFRQNDVFILDRGFREAIPHLQQCGYKTQMPESKQPGLPQLTTIEANKSRCVTMCRWVVEAVNGRFKRDYKLFRQEYFNNASRHLMLDFKIAASLINRFHPLIQDNIYATEILSIAQSKLNTTNDLATFVETNNLNRIRVQFITITGNLPELSNFPRLTYRDLILFSLGIYQIKQARSYYGEHIRNNGEYEIEVSRNVEFFNELGLNNYLLRGRIQSRHISRKTYYTYILVDSDPSVSNTLGALLGYYCNCLVGRRTVGCCAHVMSIVWYLGWARHEANAEPPASFLDDVLLIRDDYE